MYICSVGFNILVQLVYLKDRRLFQVCSVARKCAFTSFECLRITASKYETCARYICYTYIFTVNPSNFALSGLRAQFSGCGHFMVVVLDRLRCCSGSHQCRSAHRAHHLHTDEQHQCHAPKVPYSDVRLFSTGS